MVMDNEKNTIRLIEQFIPRSRSLRNSSFEADAEIFTIDGNNLVFSMDDFSKEDHFRESDPAVLGANLAVGGISDILAAGGIPLFYAHALVTASYWDERFIRQLSKGINQVLTKAEIGFLGGDIGRAETWHYTAAVIGKLEGKPLFRRGALPGDRIYITGEIGTGNLEAALTIYADRYKDNRIVSRLISSVSNRFVLRYKESRLIKKYASSCIDTSDGVCNALNEIAELNNTGYRVENLPYTGKGKLMAKALSLPVELLFLGECGEYELLFTLPEAGEPEFLARAKEEKLRFTQIGFITEPPHKVLLEQTGKIKRGIDLSGFSIRARDFDSSIGYLDVLVKWLAAQ
jgi:thiamine-monophosphate kinase